MSRRIRGDFEGVVHIPGRPGATLKAGDEVPDGIEFGDHLFAAEDAAEGGGATPPTNAELEAEIARRNEGRAEDKLIKPAGTKKAELVAALEADDAAAAAGS